MLNIGAGSSEVFKIPQTEVDHSAFKGPLRETRDFVSAYMVLQKIIQILPCEVKGVCPLKKVDARCCASLP
jgi:hypothetical protein